MTKDPKYDFNCARHDRECFVCGKIMVEDYPEKEHNPLSSNWHDATDWTSIGNWCSTVLDCAMGGRCKRAHIVICDECFKERKDRIVEIEWTEDELIQQEVKRKRNMAEFKKWWNEPYGGKDQLRNT